LEPVFSKQDLKILTAVTEQSTTFRKVKHVLFDGSLKTIQASRSNSKTKLAIQKITQKRSRPLSLPSKSFPIHNPFIDRLCGLVARVLGYGSGGPFSIPGTTRKKKE
jgi:hypothetical protein